ncbi:hypothetical protein CHLNCDRAFT_35393 [Chlorella variabilis]|uniref:Uncharacterized protein n=1 Tax=Chlorella variabilis TaxID=554065 RepID=E1ZF79_CHLVA|nr:hypothetical protein CHLNCDRAFT_35393 [Chlorella variabilis]EFN55622.1 hypothetical protein CHLNCDRAFT_35393 [Chlorella variabilis]|eukprot:XP_005847724.1 hypothetical protein CHLNCDRAFT_35393 [Chlorella variabilis]
MLRVAARQLAVARPATSLARPRSSRRQACSATMMVSPPELAARRAGISLHEAFAVDQVNLVERLGQEVFLSLSREFYDRVYADPDPSFHAVFAHSPKETAIRNNFEFLVQRFGGPPLYSQRKGHPALPRRHAPHDCSEATAERWMMHMDAALAAVPEVDADSRQRLHAYFRHTCFFLVVAQEMRQSMERSAAAQQQRAAAAAAPAAPAAAAAAAAGPGQQQRQQVVPSGCPMHAQAAPPAAGQA